MKGAVFRGSVWTDAPFGKARLSNGITLVAESHPQVRSAALGVWVKVGSAYESVQQSGISHFIEHMLFKGTERRTPLEIATALESVGGDLNAFTDREVTCYHTTTLSEHIDHSLDVLSDLVVRPSFPGVEMERERKVLLQELSMVEESPEEWIGDLILETVWKGHSFGRPIIGTRKSIHGISRGTLKKFFQKHYFAENIVISGAGNFQFEMLKEKCEQYFGSLPRSPKPVAPPEIRGSFKAAKLAVKSEVEQLHLMLAFEGLGYRDVRRFDALVLSFILGGGMSSRLFQEIREKAGLAYTVECDCLPFMDGGIVSIYVALSPKSLGKCLKILSREIAKLHQEPISLEELDRIKGQIKGSVLLSNDHMETRSEALARNEFIFGRYVPIEEVIRELDAVTPERVQELAKSVFIPEKEGLVVLGRQCPKADSLSLF